MTGLEGLQHRLDAIRVSGDDELITRAYHALSKVLFAYVREKRKIGRFPIARRVNITDVECFLTDLSDRT